MPEVSVRHSESRADFDMKAGQFTLPTLVVRDSDVTALDAFLEEQVARLPAFFEQAPVAIDLSGLAQRGAFDGFPMIVGMLRGHGMIPVGVRGASEEQKAQALALELAILPAGRKAPASPVKTEAAASRPMVIDKPVRSGQRIYAQNADLILLEGVGSGAEVMADGNIHAYGALRGRAMAGVSGDVEASIFCRELAAELVSVAGRYRVSENLEPDHVGRSVRIRLMGDRLLFEAL
jgi:septum site-determining protein MinC